ncbi:MAG: RluA family pseudouridine synthase [Candidatus Glassbacteria bacterium]
MQTEDGIREIAVKGGEAGERIDRFLSSRFRISRTRVKKAIQRNLVLINGERTTPHYRVKDGDRISIAPIESKAPPPVEPEDIEIDIIYEDPSLLVINKPSDMVVHPAPGHYTGTLYNALLYHLRNGIERGRANPGIVHRLDKDTTGLILVAKKDNVKDMLTTEMKERRISRRYLAIVWGHLRELEGTIDAGIGRHPHDRKKMSTYASRQREAVTHYKVLESFDVCDFVEVSLDTGRTHQIRVHFSSIGHPIVGDPTYGGGEGREAGFMGEGRKLAHQILRLIQRPALHAYKLTFTHPVGGGHMGFTSPLPADLRRILKLLRSTYDS